MIIKLFLIMYYFGIIACAIVGSLENHYRYRMAGLVSALCAITNSFLGGASRDFFVLGCDLWLFSTEALPDVFIVVLVSCLIRTKRGKAINKKWLGEFIFWADSLGLVTFIQKGVDKAILSSTGFFRAILCGLSTACYGGVFFHHSWSYVFSVRTLSYHAISIVGSVVYYMTQNKEALFLTTIHCLIIRRIAFMAFDYAKLLVSRACSLIRSFLEALKEKHVGLKSILHNRSEAYYRSQALIQRPFFFSSRLRYC